MGRIALVDNVLAAILAARLLAKRDNMLLILLLLNYFSVALIVPLSVVLGTDPGCELMKTQAPSLIDRNLLV
jgi:hypothetical protein